MFQDRDVSQARLLHVRKLRQALVRHLGIDIVGTYAQMSYLVTYLYIEREGIYLDQT